MIFVDTAAWHAAVIPSDPNHSRVRKWLSENHLPLLTTDYVVDETLTLLRARGERNRAISLGRQFFDLNYVTIHHIDPSDVHNAWQIFRNMPEKDWSFTDCTSRVVIERFRIKHALTFDRHFVEFGLVSLVP